MINYEDALQKAKKLKGNIDNVSEYTDAFVFGCHADDFSFGGDGPVVILKKTGRAINMADYLNETKDAELVKSFDL